MRAPADRTHTNVNSGAFGRITSMAGTPRIMQFGVKIRLLRTTETFVSRAFVARSWPFVALDTIEWRA